MIETEPLLSESFSFRLRLIFGLTSSLVVNQVLKSLLLDKREARYRS